MKKTLLMKWEQKRIYIYEFFTSTGWNVSSGLLADHHAHHHAHPRFWDPAHHQPFHPHHPHHPAYQHESLITGLSTAGHEFWSSAAAAAAAAASTSSAMNQNGASGAGSSSSSGGGTTRQRYSDSSINTLFLSVKSKIL